MKYTYEGSTCSGVRDNGLYVSCDLRVTEVPEAIPLECHTISRKCKKRMGWSN